MTRHATCFRVSVLATLLLTTALVVASTEKHAQAQEPEACDATDAVRILMLFDTSGSLKQTDPSARRRDGGLAALRGLRSLLRQYDDVTLIMAVDSFAADYGSDQWVPLTGDGAGAPDERVSDVATRNDGTLTDYREALLGALDRFSVANPSECKRVFWFTDGTHDTDRASGRLVTSSESAQIDALCAADGAAARLTSAGVEVTAVHLSSSGEDPPETLSRLYDKGDSPCPHPLEGSIIPVSDADKLADELSRVVADNTFESIEHPAPSEPCQDARTSSSSGTCEYPFQVGARTQSFTLFIHLSKLDDPDSVEILIKRPGGPAVEAEFPETEGLHRPTGLLTHAPTFNWRVIRAHQAAQSLVNSIGSQDDSQWDGEWTVVFRGHQQQLARVSPPRIEIEGLPELRAFREANQVRGEVITEDRPFRGHVRLSVDAPGTNLHGLRVGRPDGYRVMEDQRWSTPDIVSELMEVPGMADHLRAMRGEAVVQAQLVQIVDWGEGEEPIPWTVPMVEKSLVPIPVAGASGWEGESPHPRVEDVVPDGLQWLTPTGSFAITARAGQRDGRLALSRVDATSASGDKLELSLTDTDWNCDVPAETPNGIVGCPPIRIEVNAGDDELADFEFHFASYISDAERLVEVAEAQGFGEEAQQLYSSVPQVKKATGIDIRVASSTDTRAWFALLLPIVVLLALMLRVLSAARVRRWRGLDSDNGQWLEVPVRLAGGEFVRLDGNAVAPRSIKTEFVADLTQRKTRTSVGSVMLRTGWRDVLLGRRPRITATASQAACLSVQGRKRNRGIVGEELRAGWAVVRRDGNAQLVIWDLSRNQPDAADRVERAAQAAAAACIRNGFLADDEPGQPHSEGVESDGDDEDVSSDSQQPPGAERGQSTDPLTGPASDPLERSTRRRDDPLEGVREDPLA